MQEKIIIGEIIKPQGVVGQLKVKPLLDFAEDFNDFREVFIDNISYKVINVSVVKDGIFLVLKGVSDRNMAETFRGKFIYALKEDVYVEEDRFFIEDVIGCTVVTTNNSVIGKVIDIRSGNIDVYTVELEGGKTLMFPFILDVLFEMDVKNKKIIVNAKRFGEVAVYEN